MDIPAGACHADNDSGDTLAMHRPGVAYEKRDGTYIAGRNAMAYYLRKNWKKIVLPCFLTILTSGAFALWQLGLLYALDAAVRLEQKELMVWIGGELAVIALYYVLRALKRTVEVRAIRELSRQVQNDLALSMDAGLSRDAERCRLQRTLGGTVWESFFGCIGGVAGAVCNMAALLSLHWIILAAGLISTAADAAQTAGKAAGAAGGNRRHLGGRLRQQRDDPLPDGGSGDSGHTGGGDAGRRRRSYFDQWHHQRPAERGGLPRVLGLCQILLRPHYRPQRGCLSQPVSDTNAKSPSGADSPPEGDFLRGDHFFMNFASCRQTSRTSMGLATWAFIPASRHFFTSSAKASAVMAIMGMVLASGWTMARMA